jgi:cobalt-zinc-cadmium efflux system protein
MRWTGAAWIDPAAALVIAAIIALGTWGLFRESLNLAMDAVPHQIVPDDVSRFLHGVPGVQSVHDLHVWG